MKTSLRMKIAALALAVGGLAAAPDIALAACSYEVYTEYYSDPARTIWVGERIDTCDGQVLFSGAVGPYHTISREACGFCAGGGD